MFPGNCNDDAVLAMIIDECIEIHQLSEMHYGEFLSPVFCL